MNNIVKGRVVLKGTGTGIQDLLVVIYDIDPSVIGQEFIELDDNLDGVIRKQLARSWIDFPGDRIGSVLSDRRGEFALPYEDDAFKIRNKDEKRPDLVLFVLAPDEAIEGTPFGQPVIQRLIHYAFIPRANSGRIESYIISLRPDVLDKFGIRYPGANSDPKTQAERFSNFIDNSLDEKARIRTKLHELVSSSSSARSSSSISRVNNWKWLAKPEWLTTSLLFKEPDASIVDFQKIAIVKGAESLAEYVGVGSFKLTDFELAHLGIDFGDVTDSSSSVEISSCDILNLKGYGTELVRVRGILDDLHERNRVKDLLDVSNEDEEDLITDSGESTPITSTEARQLILERILGQIDELPKMEQNGNTSTISELEKIKKSINKLELSGGPANVTAFHDFYSLQVAFKHIWTAAFDESLRDQATDLYKSVVELHEEYGIEVPDVDAIQDINTFRSYLSEIKGSLSYTEVLPIDPDVREVFPQMNSSLWNRLDVEGRQILITTAGNYKRPFDGNDIDPPVSWYTSQEYIEREYERVIKYHLNSALSKVERLILEINDRLTEPYSFQYFAPGSVNYGILLNYRQEWKPDTYQVGRLVSTIPLAPGEKRSFNVKETKKKSRVEKEIEKSLLERSSEGQTIGRAETEIMAKTATSTNFRMTAQGSFSLGIGSLSSTSEFAMNQSQESSRNKKTFNEATKKSSEKVRQEREIQVEFTESSEFSASATHEIHNPNNELTVTYLLYELERRYFITSRLHRVTPVIMVAMDIPGPHEITEAWVIEHAWILRRSLLDDGFLEALDIIEDGTAADSLNVDIQQANWKTQKGLVERLEASLQEVQSLRDQRRSEFVRLIEGADAAESGESNADDIATAIFTGGLSLLFGSDEPSRADTLEARRKGTEQALKYIEGKVEELQGRLSRVRSGLQEASDAYTRALKDKSRRDTNINALLLHVRQNILHYMQAIWDSTNPDQLFLHLYHQEVDVLEPSSRACRLRRASEEEIVADIPGVVRDGEFYILECAPPSTPTPDDLVKKPLIEIADLDRPLGYKGNYIMFPLKQCAYITNFMMQEFIDDYFGVRDPDNQDGFTREELLQYTAQIWNDSEASLSDEEKEALRTLVLQKLMQPESSEDMIIVPTGQLYMEALKGEQTLLEDFKLAHRGLDVLKVQEEVRESRFENLRRAARLVSEEPNLEQPEINKVVIIKDDDTDTSVSVDDS